MALRPSVSVLHGLSVATPRSTIATCAFAFKASQRAPKSPRQIHTCTTRSSSSGKWLYPRQSPSICVVVRHYSAPAQIPSHKEKALPPDQQASYDRLRPIVDTFEARIDWAVAYGSGVMKQAQSKPGDPPSLTDLLLSTPSPAEFHNVNLRQNPSHYPLYARLMGGAGIGWAQETFGAGIWYVTMVEINGISVKYGVISTSTLIHDLNHWDTLYISGRLHKPVLPLISSELPSASTSTSSSFVSTSNPTVKPTPTPISNDSLSEALASNLRSALIMGLLLCPEQFEEDYLWEKIAGLSYSGDPRMSVPGAENPEKVKNIVRGPGAREGFRAMYGPFLRDCGVRSAQAQEKGEENGSALSQSDGWVGEGNGSLVQNTTPEHHAALFASLPLNLRKAVASHYPKFSETLGTSQEKRSWAGPVQTNGFNQVVAQELRKIIHGPALRQSIKGLFTAGPVKSFHYSLAKFRKWLKSRAKG